MADLSHLTTLDDGRGLFWVIDGDGVLCVNGTPYPFALTTDAPLANLLPLTIPTETHDITDTPDPLCQQYVISKEDLMAQRLPAHLTTVITQGEFIPYRHLVGALPTDTAELLARSVALMRWHSTTRYCGVCATPLPNKPIKICPQCQHISYPLVQPCVIVAITRTDPVTHRTQLLLAHHHRHATSDMYGLIAGYVESGECLERAVAREVLEETGLTIAGIRYMSSQPWPYPANLMMGFTAVYHSGTLQLQADELDNARFFDLGDLPHIPPVGTIARTMIDKICRG